ncbi:TolC family outer membrane protein [uncultured Porticoccus sp.]|uniref:TolC family outer membrane protein n=1 Tax=uncultured Porticoccus sp. TaxID=1256050 RepID=UPI002601EDAA|nr:TolC family outer membrane protein [uncultured Porticoccus sp.]
MFFNRYLTFFSIAGAACLSMQLNAQTINMRDAITETLQSNPEVQAELREVDARERQIREALGGYYPSVDVLAGFGYQERDPTSRQFSDPDRTRNELERHEAQLNIKQLVFDGFNTPNEHKNQIARHESAEHRAYSVGENIALEVVRSYLEVIKQQDILALAKQTLATHENIYDKMKKRSDSGVGSTADFDQISGRLALAKTNVINQTANLLDAKTNFQRVVGRYPQEGELAAPGTYSKYLPATVDEAIARAIDAHPLLKSAASDVKAVNFQYEQTKSTFYPQFHVELERDLNKNIDGVDEQVDDLTVMLRMRYNLYRGRSDEAKKQQFAYLVEKAKEVRNNTYRQVEQETRLAWVAYEAVRDQIPVLEDYVRDSESTKSAYIQQFDLGRRTLLDLLNTENETITAKQSLVTARQDLLYNEYRIFRAIGELLYTVGVEL